MSRRRRPPLSPKKAEKTKMPCVRDLEHKKNKIASCDFFC